MTPNRHSRPRSGRGQAAAGIHPHRHVPSTLRHHRAQRRLTLENVTVSGIFRVDSIVAALDSSVVQVAPGYTQLNGAALQNLSQN